MKRRVLVAIRSLQTLFRLLIMRRKKLVLRIAMVPLFIASIPFVVVIILLARGRGTPTIPLSEYTYPTY